MSNVKVTPILKAAMHSLFYDHRMPKNRIATKFGLDRKTVRVHLKGRRIDKMSDEIDILIKDILSNKVLNKKVEQRGSQWCVIHCSGPDAGKPIKCFPTREQAMAMHGAIEANKQKGVNIPINPVEMATKKNNENKFSSKPTTRDEETRLDNILKGIGIAINPVVMTPKQNNESKFSSTPTPRDEESRLAKEKAAGELVKSLFGKKEDEHEDKKAQESYSRSSETQDPDYEDEEEKKKKVKKTYCERFEELLRALDGKETDKIVTVKKEFIRNFDLALVPHHKDNNIRKARFFMKGDFDVLSSSLYKANDVERGELIIGGYASTDSVDADNEIIDQNALREAFVKFMRDPQFANINLMHGNLQIGMPILQAEINGKIYKTRFDEKGLYLLAKIRDSDEEEVQRARKQILNGELRGYSIGGEALDQRPVCDQQGQCIDKITKLDLWEITLCEKGKNPDSHFDVLKAPAS